jgi:HlyD family secretion protein
MQNKMKWLLFALLIIVGISLGISLYLSNQGDESEELVLYGNVDLRQVDLGFRVSGRLKAMHFEEGDTVEKGELLAEIDDAPYVQSLEENQARVTYFKENLAYAEQQFERRRSLVERKSVSEEDYQQAYYSQKTHEANLQEADAAYKNALIRVEDTQLFSPSKGIVYTRVREPGTILNVGEPVYSIAIDAPMWVRTYVSETQLGRVSPGMEAEVLTDTPENPVYRGHVGFISPIAEFTPKNVETPDLRTNLVYQLRVIIDSPDQGLRQGMPVTVKLIEN